ncbi:MAG: hypothetical protein K2L21_04850 [Muribaculaceae bacterium]|nr:hypothetical protein [Muribaculaceae bacterium]
MPHHNEILSRLSRKAGLQMNRSADFDVLSQAIADETGESLGVNTLKRLFGFKTATVVPRLSTMDIIARYLGSSDYDSLMKLLGNDADISMFTPVAGIDVQELEKGAQVRVSYDPGRVFLLTYLGDFRFIVNEVEGSVNIRRGDILTITQLAAGHRLIVGAVCRDGVDLGAYEAARYRGIRAVDLL